MKYLEEFIKTLGIKNISLNIFGQNKEALVFYEEMGYNAHSIDMSKSIR